MSNEVIIAFITGVLGPVLVVIVKKMLDKLKVKPDIIRDTLKESKLVQIKIESIRDEFNADRVWIAQFHNGGNFYPTGKSMAKFTIVYEVVSVGVNSIQSNFQSIPVNLFSKSINQLLENDIISIPDFKDDTNATYGLKYIAEDTGCKSGYLFAIKSIDDKFVGIFGLDFTKKKVKLTDDEVNHILVSATSLGGVLMSSNR
jgi:hypothetical protein